MTPADQQIFGKSAHLTQEQLLNYLAHKLPARERHEIEKHLVDCQLCSEALEGAAKMSAESRLLSITTELHKLARKRRFRPRKIFSIAEQIPLLAVVFLILFLIIIAFILIRL